MSIVLVLLALAVAAISLTACGGGSAGGGESAGGNAESAETATEESGAAESAGDAEVFTLKVPGLSEGPVRLNPLTIGHEKGFFQEYGIELEDQGSVAINQQISAILSGSIHTTAIMTAEGVPAIDNGAPIIAVAGGVVTTPDWPHMTFLVKKGSDIKTGRDFIGKKIATAAANGGCTGGFPLEFMRQAGVENAIEQVELITVPEEALIETLNQGNTDIIGTHLAPSVVKKLYGDEFDIVFSDWDLAEDKLGDMQFYFTREFTEENPDVTRRFVSALAKTFNWINENPDEAYETYKNAVPNINEDIFSVNQYSKDALIDKAHVDIWLELLGNPGQVQLLKNKLTFDDVATNEFNPNAS
ncbi:MAG: ABC transporter substrate-binding protein [Clostridiales Family XIII bacterium]|nr:ABC transporter substrate-binding protein [Clostridiales Family XIII bacterium]